MWSILDRNLILKKKVTKFAWKSRNLVNFWNYNIAIVAINSRWPANYQQEGPLSPKSLPIIFLSAKSKNWWKYSKNLTPAKKCLFLGGVKLLNVICDAYDLRCYQKIGLVTFLTILKKICFCFRPKVVSVRIFYIVFFFNRKFNF